MDWKKCFICQKKKNENVRSTKEGLEAISSMLQNFVSSNLFDDVISRILSLNDNEDVHEILRTNNACYHHSCTLKYNQKSLERKKEENKKQNTETDGDNNSTRTSSRRSDKHELGELVCLFCAEKDISPNLCAAGTMHATKRHADGTHARRVTDEWREMASVLQNTRVLNKLSIGDVASEETFYHEKCLWDFWGEYKSHIRTIRRESDAQSQHTEWVKASAFSKIVRHVFDTEQENPGTSFCVRTLENYYLDLLKAHGVTSKSHVSRFAERLIDSIEGLHKNTEKKVAMVYFKDSFSKLLLRRCDKPDELMRKIQDVVHPIRQALGSHKNEFKGGFDKDDQINSVPMMLLTLISMIIDGTSIENKGFSQGALTAAQIITYNFRKHPKKSESVHHRRHIKELETPLVIYNSLCLYSETRSAFMIDAAHHRGEAISYLRTLDITKKLYDSQRSQFENDGVLIPRVLRKGIFGVLAKDNIDFNGKSTMVKSHYHGTSISYLQFPSKEKPGQEIDSFKYDDSKKLLSMKLEGLPKEYSEVGPLPQCKRGGIFAPLCTMNLPSYMDTLPSLSSSLTLEFEWMTAVAGVSVVAKCKGWSSHHSSLQRRERSEPGINAIMPMINKPVHTLDTQYHIMKVNKKTTSFLNPSQTAVDTCDQPVFALSKSLQYQFPHEFGMDSYVTLLGGLHIEQSILVMHGELIRGSGLAEVLTVNDLSLIGASAAVDVNDIKRARYCLQVSACAIYKKLIDAHKQSGVDLPVLEWLEARSVESEMCHYWKIILYFQVHVLSFIRSLREGNFQVYVESLLSLTKWYFALDHYHYARWCTIHYFDMIMLEKTCPGVYEEFQKGNFSFQKTNSEFSRMALDQVHEQNNKVVKGAGGAKHLLNKGDESGLIRWETVGTDIARIIGEFEESMDNPSNTQSKKHHENNETFGKTFFSDVQKVYNGMVSNPFQLSQLTSISNTSLVFPDIVYHNISILKETGERQFDAFFNDRLIYQKLAIDEKITKNLFVLPGNVTPKSAQEKTKSMVVKPGTITKLRSAADYREKEAKLLFEKELLGVAQSIAETSNTLYHSNKAAITKRFKSTKIKPDFPEESSAIVIELSAVIQIKATCNAETFYDFAMILYHYIMKLGQNCNRIDIVCDRYFDESLKEGTRTDRGSGSRKEFEDDTKLPNNMRDDFLKNSDNKNDLNMYLAEKFMSFHSGTKTLTVTYGNTIKSTNPLLLLDQRITPCTSEEADPRLVRHALSCVEKGWSNVVVRTVDTDVLMLLVSFWPWMDELGSSKVYSLMGRGDWCELDLYDINEIVNELGTAMCKALPFLYAFTGCDTVSSMYYCGKVSFWDSLLNHPNKVDILKVFQDLSSQPVLLTDEQIKVIERFVLSVYYPKRLNATDINEERFLHFKRQPVANIRQLPLSRAGLVEHIKRACIQGGWLWRECLHNVEVPDVTEWGWMRTENGGLVPRWQIDEEQDLTIEDVVQTCACRKSVCSSCKCGKKNLSCLPFCSCERTCKNAK